MFWTRFNLILKSRSSYLSGLLPSPTRLRTFQLPSLTHFQIHSSLMFLGSISPLFFPFPILSFFLSLFHPSRPLPSPSFCFFFCLLSVLLSSSFVLHVFIFVHSLHPSFVHPVLLFLFSPSSLLSSFPSLCVFELSHPNFPTRSLPLSPFLILRCTSPFSFSFFLPCSPPILSFPTFSFLLLF